MTIRVKTTRVTLSRQELLLLRSFVENMDPSPSGDRLLDKLERAVARIDGVEGKPRDAAPIVVTPDPQPAHCRACGWEGTLPRTSPCPGCGQKLNPIFFVVRPA